LVCAGILGVSVILVCFGVRRHRQRQARLAVRDQEPKDPIEIERERLRIENQVRPLVVLEESFGVEKLPNGIYGFTYLPQRLDSPVLRSPRPDLFEVHKTPGGAIVVVGFVSIGAARMMETADGRFELRVYAAPQEEACFLVSIPTSHMMGFRQSSCGGGSFLDLELDPVCKKAVVRAAETAVDVQSSGRFAAA
jgi:hypothetical protein